MISAFLQLICWWTLHRLPFHQLLQAEKMLNYVWQSPQLQKSENANSVMNHYHDNRNHVKVQHSKM